MEPNGKLLLDLAAAALTAPTQDQTVNPPDDIACTLLLDVDIGSTGTIAVQGAIGGTYKTLLGTNATSGATTASITASGLYRFDVSGMTNVKCVASANGTTIQIRGRIVRG